mmetsp:Transcript_53124/g.158971  ORF Transcript_53124/g.158971 Transcript_53124/m.158971 type:complete len:286 (-) Transcript_53124:157-1014(-)
MDLVLRIFGFSGGAVHCETALQTQRDLPRLIAEKKWRNVQKVLKKANQGPKESDRSKAPNLDRDILCRTLRIACRHQPPLKVVRIILDLCPEAAFEVDFITSRSPLHIAVEFEASVEVIKLLADHHPVTAGAGVDFVAFGDAIELIAEPQPSAAVLVDGSGKTPLHVACESYVQTYRERRRCQVDEDAKKQKDPPLDECLLAIVKCLRLCTPTCVNLEDKAGMTALEYAILNCVDNKAVETIHRWSQRDWANREKRGYGQAGAQTGLWYFNDDETLWTNSRLHEG